MQQSTSTVADSYLSCNALEQATSHLRIYKQVAAYLCMYRVRVRLLLCLLQNALVVAFVAACQESFVNSVIISSYPFKCG